MKIKKWARLPFTAIITGLVYGYFELCKGVGWALNQPTDSHFTVGVLAILGGIIVLVVPVVLVIWFFCWASENFLWDSIGEWFNNTFTEEEDDDDE